MSQEVRQCQAIVHTRVKAKIGLWRINDLEVFRDGRGALVDLEQTKLFNKGRDMARGNKSNDLSK